MTGHLTRGGLVAILAVLAAAPPAPAAPSVRFTRIQGYAAPGTPAKYNRVGILEVGPRRARNVLVLNPGTSASAAYFEPLAESIVARAKGWQVWAVERRENLLEDHSMLDRAKAGQATPQQLFDYYLGYLDDPSVSPHFRLIGDDEVGFAREWGMRTEIEDLRRVVRRASAAAGRSCSAATRSAARSRRPTRRGTSRPAGRARPLRPGLHRRRQPPRADLRGRRGREAEGAGVRLAVAGVRRDRRAVRRAVQLRRVGARADRSGRAVDRPELPAAAREPQAARARDERRPVRIRARHRHLARAARRGAGAPGPARPERRAQGLGRRRRADAAAPDGRHVLRLGPEGPRRHGLVPPAPPDDRRGRGGRGQRQPGPAHARPAGRPRRRPAEAAADLRLRRRRSGARGSWRPPGRWPPSPASPGAG